MRSQDEQLGGDSDGEALSTGHKVIVSVVASILFSFVGYFVLQFFADFYPLEQECHHNGQCEGKDIAVQSSTNLHLIGTAMNEYVRDHGDFPPAVFYDKDDKPLYSWRVLLLPYLKEKSLWAQFELDEPWDSPNNKPLLARMPHAFMPPSQTKPEEPYATHYQVFTGGGAMFDADPNVWPHTIQEIASANGTRKTLMVVEATEPVPWTKPEDLPYSPDRPLPKLGLFSSGIHILTANSAVHRLPSDTDEETLRDMITWNNKNVQGLKTAIR